MNKNALIFNLLLAIFLSPIIGKTQDLRKLNESLGFQDGSFDVRIKTVKLNKTGNDLADPVILLNSTESITLSFDEISILGEDYKSYYFTIQHLDADWREEGLVNNDYMTGFPENPLNEYEQSIGTGVPYMNYTLTIPNEEIRLKISGNYMIKVFESSTRVLVLQKAFSVVEPQVGISAIVRSSTMDPTAFQQLELKVNHQNIRVNDAFVNLKVRIKQNSVAFVGNNPVPAFTQPNETDYTRPDKNIFPGVNEFRAFDTRNLSYNAQGVNNIKFAQGLYYVTLNEDLPRADGRFSSYKDANGKYIIGAERVGNPSLGSDYTDVYFSLKAPFVVGKVYIFGELSNWSLQNEFEMRYNSELEIYSNSLLLKQGYYNYRYVLVKDNGVFDMTTFEGNHFETENSYTVYVYFRAPGDRFDRLVGFKRINSL